MIVDRKIEDNFCSDSESVLARKQMDFKKNFSRRTKGTGSGMLASNLVKTKKTPLVTGVEKIVRAPLMASSPIRTALVGASAATSVNATSKNPPTVLKKKKLTKAERQERLRAALVIDSTISSNDGDHNGSGGDGGDTHKPSGSGLNFKIIAYKKRIRSR